MHNRLATKRVLPLSLKLKNINVLQAIYLSVPSYEQGVNRMGHARIWNPKPMFTPQKGKRSEVGPNELLRFNLHLSLHTRGLCALFTRTLSDTDTRTHYTAATQLILRYQFSCENSAGYMAQAQTRRLTFGSTISSTFKPANFWGEFCSSCNQA